MLVLKSFTYSITNLEYPTVANWLNYSGVLFNLEITENQTSVNKLMNDIKEEQYTSIIDPWKQLDLCNPKKFNKN